MVGRRSAAQVAGGPDLEVQYDIVDHEHAIDRGSDKLAEVSKRWFPGR